MVCLSAGSRPGIRAHLNSAPAIESTGQFDVDYDPEQEIVDLEYEEGHYKASLSKCFSRACFRCFVDLCQGSQAMKKYKGCGCSWNGTLESTGDGPTINDAVYDLCFALKENHHAHLERVRLLFAKYQQDPVEAARLGDRGVVDAVVDRGKELVSHLKGEPETAEEVDMKHLKDVMKYHVEPLLETPGAKVVQLKNE